MSLPDEMDGSVGERIHAAASHDESVIVASLIRQHEFIVFQQVDPDQPDAATEEEGKFSVVLAEIDEGIAVVCFSEQSPAKAFADEVADEVPDGCDLPAILLDGNSLLDGLPNDCGLLLNPGSEVECYFPPGVLG